MPAALTKSIKVSRRPERMPNTNAQLTTPPVAAAGVLLLVNRRACAALRPHRLADPHPRRSRGVRLHLQPYLHPGPAVSNLHVYLHVS